MNQSYTKVTLLAVVIVLAACTRAAPDSPAPAVAESTAALPLGSIVVLEEQGDCRGLECMILRVSCPRVDDITANLIVTGSGSAGTILLTTGGDGSAIYSHGRGDNRFADPEAIPTIIAAFTDDGYRLVEVAWPGGWFLEPSDSTGVGTITLACRFATVAHWAHDNLHEGGFFAAQGNSGGSAQIAFGLAYYGLDEILDLANLGGGPPPCPLRIGDVRPDQFDCLFGQEGFDESYEPFLSGDPRLDYPNTTVHFFLGEHEPSDEIIISAMTYFDLITTDKSLQTVPNAGHDIHHTNEGAEALIASVREVAASR